MKKVFSIILSVVFAFSLLISVFLYSIRNNVNTDNIKEIFTNTFAINDVSDDKYIGEKIENSNVVMVVNIEDNLNSILSRDYIDDEVIKEIINQEEFKNLIDKYSDEIEKYFSGNINEININQEEVEEIINKGIDIYEEKTGEVINRDDLTSNITSLITQVEDTMDKVNDIKPVISMYMKIFSDKVFYTSLSINVLTALLIVIINFNINAIFKYLSIPMLVVGIISLISGFFVSSINIDLVKDIIVGISNDLKTIGFVHFIFGVVGILVDNYIINKSKKLRN